MPHSLPLTLLPLAGSFAICQLPPNSPDPNWAAGGPLLSVTRTSDELSIVCWQAAVPQGVKHVGGWSAWRIAGRFPFETTGVIRSLVEPLSSANIGVFVISTFDTDYLLLKTTDCSQALQVLRAAGHAIEMAPAPRPL